MEHYERINKRKARELYNSDRPFIIVAKNLRPEHGVKISGAAFERMIDMSFEAVVNSYEYYNCNNETGRYAAFYVDA